MMENAVYNIVVKMDLLNVVAVLLSNLRRTMDKVNSYKKELLEQIKLDSKRWYNLANDKTILCQCGHPLGDHAIGAGECYRSTRKTEKKKNHLGKEINVKCVYNCTCMKFKLRLETLNTQSKPDGMN